MLYRKLCLVLASSLVLFACGSDDENLPGSDSEGTEVTETSSSATAPTYTDGNGLEWTLCAVGQEYDANTHSCNGDATPVFFCEGDTATACTGGVAGGDLDGNGSSMVFSACDTLDHNRQIDWRVPAKLELDGLYHGDYTNSPGSLPRTNLVFWSSTSYPHDETKAWRYDFQAGYLNYFPALRYYSVRCVRAD